MSAAKSSMDSQFHLPSYEILEFIGEGAFGNVYRVRQGENFYALKLMKDASISPTQSVVNLRNEARSMAVLNSPHIAKIHEYGEHDGQEYLVMELIEGGQLASRIPLGMSEADVVKFGIQIAQGLAEIHRRGLVHRDIKPENFLVSHADHLKIIDFGYMRDGRELEDRSSTVLATLAYAAPEQIGILKVPIDFRSDLFSVGVTLYQCVTRTSPFVTETITELVRRHTTQDYPKISDIAPSTSPVLQQIVSKLMSLDPDDRYQSAVGLLADLKEYESLKQDYQDGRLSLGKRDLVGIKTNLPLVGREAELEKMLSVWKVAQSGKPKVLQIEGEGGLGKTRLVSEFLSQVGDGRAILIEAKCNLKDSIPLGFIRQALENFSVALDRGSGPRLDELKDLVKKVGLELNLHELGLSRTLARLISGSNSYEAKGAVGPDEVSQALTTFISAIAKFIPIVLYIDDVQWIDAGSRKIIGNLLLSEHLANTLVLTTARNDKNSAELANVFITVVDKLAPVRILLKPLDERAIAKLLRDHLSGEVDPKFPAKITSLSNGNPFAVSEYVRAMLESGHLKPLKGMWTVDFQGLEQLALSTDAIELVVRRLEKVPAHYKEILRYCALLGRFVPSTLSEIVQSTDSLVRSTFELALNENLIERESDGSYHFIHDRILEGILAGFDAESRKDAHQKIAKWYFERPEVADANVFELANHVINGRPELDIGRSCEIVEKAATDALSQYSYNEACGYYKVCLEFTTGLEVDSRRLFRVYVGYGESLVMDNRHSEARDILARALSVAQHDIQRATVCFFNLKSFCSEGKLVDAWDELERGVDLLGSPVTEYESHKFLSTWWHLLMGLVIFKLNLSGIFSSANDVLERRRLLCEFYLIGLTLGYNTNPRACLELASRYTVTAQLTGREKDKQGALAVSSWVVNYLFPRSDFGINLIRRQVDAAAALGNRSHYSDMQSMLGQVLVAKGRFKDCEKVFRDSHDIRVRYQDGFNRNRDFAARSMNLLMSGNTKTIVGFPQSYMSIVDSGALHMGLLYYTCLYASLVLAGLRDEAKRVKKICDHLFMEFQHDQSNLGLPYLCILLTLFETDDFGREMELAEAACINGIIKTGRDELFVQRFGYAVLGYIALRRVERATDDLQKRKHLLRLQEILSFFEAKGMSVEIQRAHYLNLRGAYLFQKKRFWEARKAFELALTIAEKSDSTWCLYCVSVEFGKFLYDQNSTYQGKALLRQAFKLSEESGWLLRMDNLVNQFPFLAFEKASDSKAEKSVQRSVTIGSEETSLTSRYVQALIRVSMAATSELRPEKQAANALDELILLMGAERGMIFIADETTGELKYTYGRDGQQKNLSHSAGYSNSFVKRVANERKAIVSTNSDVQGVNTSQSIVINDLRSLMAAPLQFQEKFLGVLYLDSRMSKGLFTSSDADILSAVASQICIFFEMAKVMEMEREKTELQRALEIQTATADMRKSIQIMADNMKQSMFAVGADGIVVEPVSKFSTKIFGSDIRGLSIKDLLYSGDRRSSESFQAFDTAMKVVFGEDEMQWSLSEDSFPQKLELGAEDVPEVQTNSITAKSLKIQTSPLWSEDEKLEKLMFVIEDVTEIERLEKRLNEQARGVQILQEIMEQYEKDPGSFIARAAQGLTEMLNEVDLSFTVDVGERILRDLHTVKGNARFYNLMVLSQKVHEAESELVSIKSVALPEKAREGFFRQLLAVKSVVQEYQGTLHKIEKLSGSMGSVKPENGSNKNLKLEFEPFGSMLDELKAELGKTVKFEIRGDDVIVENETAEILKEGFVHLIRNSLDHGIEKAEVRRKLGKSEEGVIRILIANSGEQVQLILEDDGGGIDARAVAVAAVKKGILSQTEVARLNNDQLVSLVFHPGFSTKVDVTSTSGRGYGMDAVKASIERLGGSIKIKTESGVGTQFQISLPGKIVQPSLSGLSQAI
jgi:serine/threonine protein kinase/signal transduction histidine kinase/tetratricopeptide (TPR) repeat protein